MSKSNSGPCPYPDETCEPNCRQCIERAKPKTCEWKRIDKQLDIYSIWESGCEHLVFGTEEIYINEGFDGFKFCPFCGGTITEVDGE